MRCACALGALLLACFLQGADAGGGGIFFGESLDVRQVMKFLGLILIFASVWEATFEVIEHKLSGMDVSAVKRPRRCCRCGPARIAGADTGACESLKRARLRLGTRGSWHVQKPDRVRVSPWVFCSQTYKAMLNHVKEELVLVGFISAAVIFVNEFSLISNHDELSACALKLGARPAGCAHCHSKSAAPLRRGLALVNPRLVAVAFEVAHFVIFFAMVFHMCVACRRLLPAMCIGSRS